MTTIAAGAAPTMPQMSARRLATFASVRLQHSLPGPINLRLSGKERGGAWVELLFSHAGISATGAYGRNPSIQERHAPAASLPEHWRDVEVQELLDVGGRRSWQLTSASGVLQIEARAMQLHSPAARRFFHAVPAAPLPLRQLVVWSLLLAILRVPGAARVIAWLRSR